MLATFFYFIGMLIFLSNLLVLSKFSDYIYIKSFFKSFQKVTGKKPEKKDFSDSNYQFYSFLILNSVLTVSWFFIGLLSKNWLFFLLYFLYNPILDLVSKSKFKILNNSIEYLRLTLNIIIIATLVINHFHLHINLTNFILFR